ncbi:NUDIX domain-containing protein [Aliikangiella marina]|uniref:ADP-ribose pyrophosphatase n=1 Tax=Aliikangiella marina TaxID=1712262 RepID=A0A545T752_9GAMM|nr:NUDIX domain-containing protein [Aliikangiella marina]TQV73050.1 NUDIX domain-containing protein [Aliikangiella marina]
MRDSVDLSFKQNKRETMYDGFFKLRRYTYQTELFQGGWSEPFQREMFERGHAVAVLLIDLERQQVVMVEQFRPGAVPTQENPWLMEPVAGIIEPGESPVDVAMREAEEEAGCKILRIRKVFEYLVSPGGTTETIELYVGEVDSRDIPEFAGLDHEHEDIKIHKIPIETLFEMLENDAFSNGVSIIAIQWLKLNWAKMAEIWP